MGRIANRGMAWFMCVALFFGIPGLCVAQSPLITVVDTEEEDFPEDLSPEEQAQWQQWSEEEAAREDKEDAHAENAAELTQEDEAALSEIEAAMEENAPMDEVDLSNLEPNEALPSNVLNILLLGVDNRTTSLERGLSDAVVICSINKETGSVKLSSIARDTGVIVPGFKSKNRINVAYKRGGPELSMKTVNRNFQLNVQRYVVVNIHGLADIIDALGGIDIEMTKREAGRINFELRKEPMDKVKRKNVPAVDGVQHLDGMQAVTYARIRGIDSDLERTRRQRHLLETMFSHVMKDMDLVKFANLVSLALKHGDTNLTTAELTELAIAVLDGEAMANLRSGGQVLEEFRIPLDKKFGYRNVNGNSLIYLSDKNLKFSVEQMQEFIYGETF